MAEAAPTRRLFFALWPAADVATALECIARQAQAHCGGRRMQRDSVHLTLAFLGDLPLDRVASVEAAADDLAAEAFRLSIDRLGYWRHNRILWAGSGTLPAPLTDLVGKLTGRLRAAGFHLESRPFAAPVTLLRDADCREAPATGAAIDWPVAKLGLVESNPSSSGARYLVRRQWPLRGANESRLA
jgi:2'-5' RNA ligase